MDIQEIKYIDLCCGIGGFRVAIEKFAKKSKYMFKCILSADIKLDAIEVYNLNFNENIKKTDIYSLNPKDIDSFDLLCAGFPCQTFSSAGNKQGFSDKRGGMIFKIIEICDYHHPDTVILENVSNLLSLDKGQCIKKIIELFEKIGYNITYKKLDSSNFGVSQSRERVYIVCTYKKVIDFEKIKYKKKKLLQEVIDIEDKSTKIDDNFSRKIITLHQEKPLYGCKIGDKRGGINNIHSWDISYNGEISEEEKILMNKLMLERRKKHWAKKKGIEWMDGMPLTIDEIKTFYKNEDLHNMLDNLVRLKYLTKEKPKDLINGKRKYKEDAEEGFNICKGKLSFPINKILDPNDVSPTLTATDCNKLAVIVNDNVLRTLNVNELKKICGFPSDFIIPNHVNYYDLFGNMVIPHVIRAILKIVY